MVVLSSGVLGQVATLSMIMVAPPIEPPMQLSVAAPQFSVSAADTTIGAWRFVERLDAMTDEVLRYADTRNAGGYELRIFRIASGKVHGLFRVPDAIPDVLNHARWPMYRIDQHDPVDLDGNRAIARFLDEPPVLQEPKWVQFLIWHGEDPYPDSGTLHHLMSGERVVFRYHLLTGGYKDVAFALDSASDAIVKALELTPPIGP